MLQNINQLIGHKLAASDGEIGHVRDFYFDDQTWAVRYLVADTGNWLNGRQVLLARHALSRLGADGKNLPVNLTRSQVEGSPAFDSHRPVSRQYEEEYFRYYGWPVYWIGDGYGGLGGSPGVVPVPKADAQFHHGHNQRDDRHLRSTLSINGYQIQTTDGPIGAVCDYMVDDRSWIIHDLVVEAGHWYAGKKILITTDKIERISYEESKVYVKLTKADIQQTWDNEVAKGIPHPAGTETTRASVRLK
jgi:uncharacterized protein YrrD